MNLLCDSENIPQEELLDKMEEGAVLCVESEGIPAERVEISLTFVTEQEIQELNRLHRQVNRVTDVLSFPQYEDLNELPQSGDIVLGDVVICTQQAQRQAEEFGHSVTREMVYLFVHSVCHLLGYDHMEEEDKRLMREKEEAVMSNIHLER